MSQNNIRIQGHDVMMFDSTGKSFAFGTNASLSITTEMKEVSDKDTSKYGMQSPGKISWTLSSDHTLNWSDFLEWTEKQKNQTDSNKLKIWYGLRSGWEGSASFDPDSEVNNGTDGNRTIDTYTYALTGYVFIDSITQNSSNGDFANYTVNFTGVGPLNKEYFQA